MLLLYVVHNILPVKCNVLYTIVAVTVAAVVGDDDSDGNGDGDGDYSFIRSFIYSVSTVSQFIHSLVRSFVSTTTT